jgi:alpha-galactosidase
VRQAHQHADRTPLWFKYVNANRKVDANSSLTSIVFKDPVYPFEVTLFYNGQKRM